MKRKRYSKVVNAGLWIDQSSHLYSMATGDRRKSRLLLLKDLERVQVVNLTQFEAAVVFTQAGFRMPEVSIQSLVVVNDGVEVMVTCLYNSDIVRQYRVRLEELWPRL